MAIDEVPIEMIASWVIHFVIPELLKTINTKIITMTSRQVIELNDAHKQFDHIRKTMTDSSVILDKTGCDENVAET